MADRDQSNDTSSLDTADLFGRLADQAQKTLGPIKSEANTGLEAAAHVVTEGMDKAVHDGVYDELANRRDRARRDGDHHGDQDHDHGVEGDDLDDVEVAEGRELPPPSDPAKVAREFVDDQFTDGDHLHLRHHANTFYGFDGKCWPEEETRHLRSLLYAFTEDAWYWKATKEGPVPEPWRPTRHKVDDIIDALSANTFLDSSIQAPSWLDDVATSADLIVVNNGLLHIDSRTLLPHTSRFWSHHYLPFDYDPIAPAPSRWLRFLTELWGDDQDSIDTLQEIFGYCLTSDTRQQKLFLVVGPKRTGKGTLARVLTGLLGAHNVAGPTMAGLGNEFGLAPLIDKPLAIISDARITSRTDQGVVIERLLSISGEDSLSINRKYRDHWFGRLPTRFLILSNELPKLADSSGAFTSRFIALMLRNTFYGKEDPTLTDVLLTEATGIINWALDGLDRLGDRGHFIQPAASAEAIRQLEDLASPVTAFIRDRCKLDPNQEIPKKALYGAWREWCDANGHKRTESNTFARDLRSAYPEIHETRPRVDDGRLRFWTGLTLLTREGAS